MVMTSVHLAGAYSMTESVAKALWFACHGNVTLNFKVR